MSSATSLDSRPKNLAVEAELQFLVPSGEKPHTYTFDPRAAAPDPTPTTARTASRSGMRAARPPRSRWTGPA